MAAKTKPNHCRLSVILATEAAKGILLRRGPSNWVQLILWDTATDTFTEGQWFKGRIYAERSDLSPDGTKLIYFAAKYHKPYGVNKAGYSNAWTAISKPPYYTALALWNEFGSWGGGGYFIDNRTVCMWVARVQPAHADHLPSDQLQINSTNCKSHTSAWLWRLQQNGWQVISKGGRGSYDIYPKFLYESPAIYQRESPDHRNRLIIQIEGYNARRYGDSRILTYSLIRHADQKEFLVSDIWADWDQQGRLVYVEEGKLFAGQLRVGEIEPHLLADFNLNRPKLIKAPEWATTWT